MAYKFQLGAARLSGSLVQEGDISADASNVDAVQLSASATIASPDFIASAGEVSIIGAATASAGMDIENGLLLDGVAVSATATQLNFLDNVDLVSGDFQKLADITVTAGEINHLGGVTSGVQGQLNSKLSKASNLSDLTDAATARRNLGVEIGVDVQAYDAELDTLSGMSSAAATAAAGLSATEYGFLDGAIAGSAQASKALVADASRGVVGIGNLEAAQLSASADVFAGGGLYGGSIGLADADGLIAVSGGLAQTAGEMHLDPSVAGSGLTLTNGVLDIDLAEASAGSVAVADDSFLFVDATDGSTKKDSFSNFAGRIAGDGLGDASGVLSVNVAAGLEISGDNIQVSASGITNQMLAGNITAEKLVKGDALYDDAGSLAVRVDGSSLEVNLSNALQVAALGITNSMLAGNIASSKIAELNAFSTSDLAEGSNEYFTQTRARASVSATDAGGDGSFTYSSATGVFTYTGPSAAETQAHFSVLDTNSVDMHYSSGQFSADVKVDASDSLVIDPNGAGLQLKQTIPGNRSFTGDITINNLNVTGTLTTINTTELEVADKNILIASGAASAAIAAGAGLTVDGADVQWKYNDSNDDGSISQDFWIASGSAGLVSIEAKEFHGQLIGSFQEQVTTFTAGGTLKVGVNKVTAQSSALSFNLPASPSEGDVVRFKAHAATSNVNTCTIIAPAGGANADIDGPNKQILLESPHAAISLIYVSSINEWMVF